MGWDTLKNDRSGENSLESKLHDVVEEGLALGSCSSPGAMEAGTGAPSTTSPSASAAGAAPAAISAEVATGSASSAPAAGPAAAAAPGATAAAEPAKLAKPEKVPWVYKPPPAPPGKSYLPTFQAPEAYGKKKDQTYANIAKEVEEKMAKIAAKKERERLRAKQKGKKKKVVAAVVEEDDGEKWQLFFMIALGVLVALSEALDLDVLIGIMLMPFMKGMKYLSEEFDNVNLDPQVWIDAFGNAYNNMCKNNPGGFVGTDLTFFAIFVNLILFEADLAKWWRERNIVRDGYEQIDEDGDGKLDGVGSYAAAPAAAPVIHARAITHPLQLPCVTWTLLLPHSTTTSAEPPLRVRAAVCQPTDEGLEELFHEIDENGGGSIDRDEMEEAITKLFGKLDSEMVDQMMKAADTDGGGDIE